MENPLLGLRPIRVNRMLPQAELKLVLWVSTVLCS